MTGTEKIVKAKLAVIGIVLKVDREWNEYHVYPKGENEHSDAAYHTSDLEDAYDTGKVMAKQLG